MLTVSYDMRNCWAQSTARTQVPANGAAALTRAASDILLAPILNALSFVASPVLFFLYLAIQACQAGRANRCPRLLLSWPAPKVGAFPDLS